MATEACTAGIRVYCRVQAPTGMVYDIPVESVRVEYAVNEIPTASIRVLPGREAHSMLISAVHQITDTTVQMRVSVMMEVRNSRTEPFGITPTFLRNGSYRLFEGYVSEIQYARDVTSLYVDLNCVHWLYDLNFSSSLTDQFVPATPRDITFNAFLNSSAGSLGNLITVDEYAFRMSPMGLAADVWTNGLFPILMHIASRDRFAWQYFPHRVNDSAGRLAAQAMSLIRTDVPLQLQPLGNGHLELLIAAGMLMSLTHYSAEYNPLAYPALAETTLWERMVKVLSPLFMFAIIPYPTQARIVPYCPTYNAAYWGIMPPSHVFALRRISKNTKPLQGVVVFSNQLLVGGSDLGVNPDTVNDYMFGGAFSAPNVDEGLTLFRQAPPYYNYFAMLPMYVAMQSLAIGISTARLRSNGYALPMRIPPPVRTPPMQNIMMGVMNELAHYYYTLEFLNAKRLQLIGPLRMDVSPGSIIGVMIKKEKFLGPVAPIIYGYVTSVTHIIRNTPGNPAAITSLELAFLREGLQAVHPAYVTLRHPLYSTVWWGSRFDRFDYLG